MWKLRLRNKLRINKNNTIQCSPSAKIVKCEIRIKGTNNKLIIGDNVYIRASKIEIDGNNCSVIIGNNTIIGHNCYLSSRENNTSLIINSNCMLSRNVKLMTSDGHDITVNNKRINFAKDIKIEKHCWLADNVTILKGVVVGSDSIVGINSTLTKSVPANSIAAGNPAKIIKSNVSWNDALTF